MDNTFYGNTAGLCHYGKLGMRWGQHKYHNKYGMINRTGIKEKHNLESEYDRLSNSPTLNKKGQKRITDIENKYQDLTGTHIGSRPVKKPPKRLQDMTDEELSAYNTRKQLEETYLKYQPKPEVSKGKQFAKAVLTKAVIPAMQKAGQDYLTKTFGTLLTGLDATVKEVNTATKDTQKATKDTQKATGQASNKETTTQTTSGSEPSKNNSKVTDVSYKDVTPKKTINKLLSSTMPKKKYTPPPNIVIQASKTVLALPPHK